MVLESKNGMMLTEILEYMKENGLKTLFLVMVNKPGAIIPNIQVLFLMIRCMEMEHSPGLMAEAMLENSKMARKAEKVSISVMMVRSIWDNTSTISSMAKEN